MRVVSLVPSSTETLLALGADVVACSRFCEQPGIDHVGGTKNPDIDAIVAIGPDLVVLDREENRREDHDALVSAGLSVFVSDVRSVESALEVVDALADATGLARPAGVTVPSSGAGAGAGAGTRRSVFVPIWRRPWMTISASTYGASVLAHFGLDVLSLDDPSDYPVVELDAIASLRPELALVPSEPYEFTEAHLDELRGALVDTEIVRVDGQDLFWWGVRTPGAIARLGAVVAESAGRIDERPT